MEYMKYVIYYVINPFKISNLIHGQEFNFITCIVYHKLL